MSRAKETIVDDSGRVTIPEEIRSHLGLTPGSRLTIEEQDNEEITLRPLRDAPLLAEKDGVLVVQSRPAGQLEGSDREDRRARMSHLVERSGL